MYINYKLLIVFRLTYNRIDDREETNQGNGWCHYNTASTENISIERVLVRASAAHQEETDDDNCHTNANKMKFILSNAKFFLSIIYNV